MRLRSRIPWALFTVLWLASLAAEDRQVPEYEQLRESYESQVERTVNSTFRKDIEELEGKYLAALNRTLAEAQSKGRLEEALALKSEIDSMGARHEMAELDEDRVPATLANLRGVFSSSRAEIDRKQAEAIAPLNRTMIQELEKLTEKLTQTGRLEDAVFVKARKDALQARMETGSVPSPRDLAGESEFTNSLGMRFAGVTGTDVLFCIHETRKSDFAAFAAENPTVPRAFENSSRDSLKISTAPDHPVVEITWSEAKEFCAWLSKKENRTYRLPTDREWSYAVGIASREKRDATLESLDGDIADDYPWGRRWPPPDETGNFADAALKKELANYAVIEEYHDGFAGTAPVMSFEPNKYGLYDLEGNVKEWCEDWMMDAGQKDRVRRGGSWRTATASDLLSSRRAHNRQNFRSSEIGFRIVVETAEN